MNAGDSIDGHLFSFSGRQLMRLSPEAEREEGVGGGGERGEWGRGKGWRGRGVAPLSSTVPSIKRTLRLPLQKQI